MKLKLKVENSFKGDIKKIYKQGIITQDEIESVIESLLCQIPLAPKYQDHKLTGDLKAYKECHIKPNLLLVYKITKDELHLVRLGSHSELFKK